MTFKARIGYISIFTRHYYQQKQQVSHLKRTRSVLLLQHAKKDLSGGSGVNIERLNFDGLYYYFLKVGVSEIPIHSIRRPPTEK